MFVISLLVNIIMFLPVVLNFIFLVRDRDIIINYREYDRKNICIDSIRFEDNEGVNTEWVYGYSKQLNNYKTIILFNSIKEKELRNEIGMDENGKITRDVWFREKFKYAYPANNSDKVFPIKPFIFNYIKLPLIWITIIMLSILLYRAVKK